MIVDYENKTFIERRQEFINWIQKIAEYSIIPVKSNSTYKNSNYNSVCNVKFYELKDGELSEPKEIDPYNFDKNVNTRDQLISELTLEFDIGTQQERNLAIQQTILNLQKLNIHFAVFEAEGQRSPHIRIYDLFKVYDEKGSLLELEWDTKERMALIFARKVVPFEYFHLLDKSILGQHTIQLEFAKHHRTGKMFKLIYEYVPEVKECN